MEKSNVTSFVPKDKKGSEKNSFISSLSPREIVSELDRYVVGQNNAKRAVAIALRNRWRRQALKGDMKDEVLPKNILMIGPTGVGKTEISRRLSKLAEAPFVKVEATRFTEVGYVGRDVEQIVRDLLEIAIAISRRSLTICSTSLPTYPTSVKRVASTFTNGASANLDKRLDISVLPTPVGPIINIFFGNTSSLISPFKACLLHLFLKAMATARFALFCPTTYLSSSDTISLGDKELIKEFLLSLFLFLGTIEVTFDFSIIFFQYLNYYL